MLVSPEIHYKQPMAQRKHCFVTEAENRKWRIGDRRITVMIKRKKVRYEFFLPHLCTQVPLFLTVGCKQTDIYLLKSLNKMLIADF